MECQRGFSPGNVSHCHGDRRLAGATGKLRQYRLKAHSESLCTEQTCQRGKKIFNVSIFHLEILVLLSSIRFAVSNDAISDRYTTVCER